MASEHDEWGRENLKHAITFVLEALKTMLLLNGGAAVALLALLGPLSTKTSGLEVDIGPARYALYAFGSGSMSIAVTFLVAYLAQLGFMQHAVTGGGAVWALGLRILGILTFFGSVGLFVIGLVIAAGAIHART